MTIITEEKHRNHPIYRLVTLDDAGHITDEQRFDCRVEITRKDGILYFLVYDNDGHLRAPAVKFLNEYMAADTEATRRLAAVALNSFHTWCDITATDYTNLCQQDIKNYQNFALGQTVQGHRDPNDITFRRAKTVNAYYCYIKQYVRVNHWNFEAFEHTTTKEIDVTIQDIPQVMRRRVDTNRVKEDPQEQTEPKKHLTPDECERLLHVIKESGNMTAYTLVQLQLTTGVRPGAALGLTTQDIESKLGSDGKYRYYINLRNRVSDRRDQSCKGLYHPKRVEEYAGSNYRNSLAWTIEIAGYIHDLLMTYIDDTRDPAKVSPKVLRNIREDAAADNIDPKQFTSNNEYVFVGRSGRRLTAQTYNAWLKTYFTAIGIPVDTGKKSSNCAHKLRHSFAMYCTTYAEEKKTRGQLKVLLTHTSELSGAAYFTPTEQERMNMMVACQEEILARLGLTTDTKTR